MIAHISEVIEHVSGGWSSHDGYLITTNLNNGIEFSTKDRGHILTENFGQVVYVASPEWERVELKDSKAFVKISRAEMQTIWTNDIYDYIIEEK